MNAPTDKEFVEGNKNIREETESLPTQLETEMAVADQGLTEQ